MVHQQPYWVDSPTVRASHLASISSRSVSPSPSLGRGGLFYGTGAEGLPNGGGPSAIPSVGTPPPNRVLAPGAIQWIYLDASGQVQGPFDGVQMNGWFRAGWLPEDLQLRRIQDKEWITLGRLVQNLAQQNPFEAVLPLDVWDQLFLSRSWTPSNTEPIHDHPYVSTDQKSASALGPASWGQPSEVAKLSHEASPELDQHVSGILSDLAIEEPTDKADIENTPYSSAKAPPSQPNDEPVSAASRQKEKATTDETATDAISHEVASEKSVENVSTPIAPAPAPTSNVWGKPASNATSSPRLSLKEVKEREMERKRDRNAEMEAAAVAAAEAASAQIEDFATPTVSDKKADTQSVSQPTWVSKNSSPSAPPKSIAEIRKEQQAKKPVRAQQQQKGTYAAVLGGHNGTVVRPTVQKSQQTVTPAVPKTPAAWNVPEPASNPTQASNTTSSPRRTVPKPLHKPSAPRTQPKKASPADELVQWAKVTFRQGLKRDVDHMELLEVFLSLPNTQDARDFISESIFSYATTLDGRRFAHEFLNRKKAAEVTFRAGETWKDILRHFNPEMETDPSFKVVTKKRYKPIARLDSMRT